jgi:hypothetical protein
MISAYLRRCNLPVAVGAGFAARVFEGKLSILYRGQGPVMSPKAKAGRDQQLPDHEIDNDEGCDRDNKVAYLLRYTFPHKINRVCAFKLIQSMRECQ